MTTAPVIVWFRQDLRLADNPALAAAAATGAPVIALYVLDDETPDRWRLGGASRWWLHGSLEALTRDLATLYGEPPPEPTLVLRRGPAIAVLADLVEATGAGGVYWNRSYEPYAVARDRAVEEMLARDGIAAHSFNGALLFEPWEIATQSGTPFRVYTPFWKACLAAGAPPAPAAAPKRLAAYPGPLDSVTVADLALRPSKPDWAGGLRDAWTPGEASARARLGAFVDDALAGYAERRDRPDQAGTSRLSPHLHFGELSPRQVWHAVAHAAAHAASAARGKSKAAKNLRAAADKLLSELGWREFAHHLLFHEPALPELPLRPEFERFPWVEDADLLRCWQRGRTGYPFVDAGMRALWATGWMHNRVRMVAASFLVKHLLQPWQAGADWFWDTLVDADLANNAAGWQWVAGCGADAAPFFRIFNPVLQGRRYDPGGAYVRRWLPALARLPDAHIHAPWMAPASVLADAGVVLGETYPAPVVEHEAARDRALAAYNMLRQ